jgi:hypothetical protein
MASKLAILVAVAALACGKSSAPVSPVPPSPDPPTPSAAGCARVSVGITSLMDLRSGSYQGQLGGLYPGGSNARPADHEAEGLARARSIAPMDRDGVPDSRGRYALVSLGMSNTTQEFSVFKTLADTDGTKDSHLVIVDGAQGGQTAKLWAAPGCACWATLDSRLASAGVSAKQVAVMWIKQADSNPNTGWPAHAQTLRDELNTILHMLADRFPNLRMVYLSSRIYAGYATTSLNPEPYAYEGAFSVRWLIDDQLSARSGMGYGTGPGSVPWIAWGPYLWADGLTPRSDGLTWACSDLTSTDGTHPSSTGQRKVADMLLSFFRTDSTARAWYLAR